MLMSAITGYYAPSGQGWRLAYSLVTLAHELADVYGDQLTCLGTVGDTSHSLEGAKSDHNPVVLDPANPSIGIVRAIDFGGDASLLLSIRAHLYGMSQDLRLKGFGFLAGPDGQETNFPLGSGWNQPGDTGHLHVSVTQTQWPSVPNGYIAAVDSTAAWGFAGTDPSGGGTPIGDGDLTPDEHQILVNCQNALHAIQAQFLGPAPNGGNPSAYTIDLTHDMVAAIPTTPVDVNALAAAIVTKLPAGALTKQDVADALESTLAGTPISVAATIGVKTV